MMMNLVFYQIILNFHFFIMSKFFIIQKVILKFYKKSKKYLSIEQYFQSQKFKGTKYEEIIINEEDISKCIKLGNDKNLPILKNWDQIKDDIMYNALFSKFYTNSNFKWRLLLSGNRNIIFNSKNDNYWGVGFFYF
jgi:N-glycosidase YbiA